MPGIARPTSFDFFPMRGISASVTLNFRTIRYLGISPFPSR